MSRSTRHTAAQHPGFILCELPATKRKPKTKMADGDEGHPVQPNPLQQNQDQLVELLQKLLTLNKNTETQGLANICKYCKHAQDADLFIKYTSLYTTIVASAFQSMANQLFHTHRRTAQSQRDKQSYQEKQHFSNHSQNNYRQRSSSPFQRRPPTPIHTEMGRETKFSF